MMIAGAILYPNDGIVLSFSAQMRDNVNLMILFDYYFLWH